MQYEKVVSVLLRVGLAFALLYPPFNALSNPDSWIGYIPGFMRGIAPVAIILHVFGLLELVLAVWILSGWKIFLPCALATVILLAIVFFNLPNFEVLFRDLSIAAMAAALTVDSYYKDHLGQAT